MSTINISYNSRSYKDLSPAEFESRILKDPLAVILDVRTAGEFLSGHIPGAINIEVTNGSFHQAIETLDKEKSYYVYCRSGGRSAAACGLLANSGFNKIYNLDGGIMSYEGKIEFS